MPKKNYIDVRIGEDGDSIKELAQKYYGTAKDAHLIKEFNNLKSYEVRYGQKLKIPME